MVKHELYPINQEKIRPVYEKVVRIFPFAPVSLNSLHIQLEELFDGQRGLLSAINVYLGMRKKEKRFSDSMLSPYGGRVDKDSTVAETAYNRLLQETKICPVPYPNFFIKDPMPFFQQREFKYQIANTGAGRVVSFWPMPCMPIDPEEDFDFESNQNSNKEYYLKSYGFSVEEFKQLIQNNHQSYQIEGHLCLDNQPDIKIKQRDHGTKKRLLIKLSSYLEEMDLYFKKELVQKMISNFRNDFQSCPINLDPELMTPEACFLEMYQVLQEVFWPYFNSSYQQILAQTYMNHFQKNKLTVKSENNKTAEETSEIFSLKKRFLLLKEDLESNNLGVDILHYLPLYSSYPETVKVKNTRGIVTAIQFLRKCMNQAIYKNGGINQESDFLKTFTALKEKSLDEQFNTVKNIDQEILNILNEVTGIEPQQILRFWLQAQRFIPDFANELKAADPKLLQFYQFHEPLNEIISNSIAATVYHALNYQENTLTAKTLRFEAARQLALFLKLLVVRPIYDEKTLDIPNPLDMAITEYFGKVVDTNTIELNNPETGINYQKIVERRQGKSGTNLIIDEKPIKSIVSFTRKSYEEQPAQIRDIYSVGIVIPEDNQIKPAKKIGLCQQIRKNFLNYLKVEFPDSEIVIHDQKNTYANFQRNKVQKAMDKSGKRTGSVSSSIIREKLLIELKNQGKSYFYELVFYPFETLSYIAQGELMGWREKLQDDPNYSLRRTLLPLKESLGLQSFYELLFPVKFYSTIARQNATVLQKKE